MGLVSLPAFQALTAQTKSSFEIDSLVPAENEFNATELMKEKLAVDVQSAGRGTKYLLKL